MNLYLEQIHFRFFLQTFLIFKDSCQKDKTKLYSTRTVLFCFKLFFQGIQNQVDGYSIRWLFDIIDLYIYIYILIALALDESIILDVPQFPMQNIYQSCDLGRNIGRRNVNASQ